MVSQKAIKEAAGLIRQADALVIGAGAGMSVDSGLPDFRGKKGMWTSLLSTQQRKRGIARLMLADCFREDPVTAWRFYGEARQVCTSTVPHEGYSILRRHGQRTRFGAFVYTSNVDGHFEAAGFSRERIVECHGSIHFLQCSRPCSLAIWPAQAARNDAALFRHCPPSSLPRCMRCGELARPNFLMFSDGAWVSVRTGAQRARLQPWLERASRPVAVEIGAGVAIPSVRLFTENLRIPLIRINVHEPDVPGPADVSIAGAALTVLRQIEEELAAA